MKKEKKFHHMSVQLPQPLWGTPLANNVIELEQLRERRIIPYNLDIFFDLKAIFDQLENWASARIEGNQTRLLDALDPSASKEVTQTTGYQELRNLRQATDFIDDYCKNNSVITKAFILKVHRIVTHGLPVGDDQPGDETPGKFRLKNVEITQSLHVPPMGLKIDEYIDEYVSFANHDDGKQYYLLKLAVLHHRFTWIHPFGNGNGRMARLMTYASLQLMGYGTSKWRIINPAIVFYSDRKLYYSKLGAADSGTMKGLLEWSDYFLEGLLRETNKIDRLCDAQYVTDNIIMPALKMARDSDRIGDQEYVILRSSLGLAGMNIVSGNLDSVLGTKKSPVARSRILSAMRSAGLLKSAWNSKQKYVIQLQSPILMRHFIKVLEHEGFIKE